MFQGKQPIILEFIALLSADISVPIMPCIICGGLNIYFPKSDLATFCQQMVVVKMSRD